MQSAVEWGDLILPLVSLVDSADSANVICYLYILFSSMLLFFIDMFLNTSSCIFKLYVSVQVFTQIAILNIYLSSGQSIFVVRDAFILGERTYIEALVMHYRM